MGARVAIVRGADRDREDWGDLADRRGAVSWKTLIDATSVGSHSLALGLASLRPGEALEPHRHPQVEVYLVMAGEVIVTACGAEHLLGPGDAAFFPGGELHGCRNEASEEASIAFVFAADSASEVEYSFPEA